MSLLKKNKTNKEPRDLSILFPVLFSVIMICALVGVGTYVYSTVRNHDRRVINEMYASSTKIEIIETGEYVEEYPEITMRVYVSNEKCDCPDVTEQKSLEYYISTLENMLYDSGYEKNDVVLLERGKETDYEFAVIEAETSFLPFFTEAEKIISNLENTRIIDTVVVRPSEDYSMNRAYVSAYQNALTRAEGIGDAFGNVKNTHIVSVRESSSKFIPEEYKTVSKIVLELSLELE